MESKFSKGLEEEIQFKIQCKRESCDEGEVFDENDARKSVVGELIEDCDIRECAAYEFRHEINDFAIAIGIYREVTQDELDRTTVSRGKKYDLKRKGKFYSFDSWKPLYGS